MKPDEIVLVEDGPLGDELIRVIIDWKSLLRERLVLLRNDCNLGLTKSLNKGLSVVKSDFIAVWIAMIYRIHCDLRGR